MSAYEHRTLRMTRVYQRMTNVLCLWLPYDMLNMSLNRQAYADMSIYVADTPDILQKYGTNTLAVR